MADDEDVVFRDSMLYEHLKGTGFCDGDIDAQDMKEEEKEEEEEEKEEAGKPHNSVPPKSKSTGIKGNFLWKLLSAILGYLWDEACRKEVNQLHSKEAESLTDAVLQCPLLEDEDAAYIDSFAASIDSGAKPDEMEESDGMMTQVITHMGILGISLAYGCFRMVYMKSPDDTAHSMVWALDVFAVLLTVMCLMPFTMRFAWAGRLIRKLRGFSCVSCSLVLNLSIWEKISRRTIRLVQELELVSHGFTMVNHIAPASRLESSGLKQRQCPNLRKSAFLSARRLMLNFKEASKGILKKFPSHVELEGVTNFLANTPLKEYGDCVNLEDGPELHKLTDAFCLSAIKEMVSLCNTHISEFLRLMTLACLLRPQENFHNLGFVDQLSVVKSVHNQLDECSTSLHRMYRLHKYMVDKEHRAEERKQRAKQRPLDAVYIAVHSLNLHLQAALRKVQVADDHLQSLQDAGEQTLTPDLSTVLLSDLKVMGRELDACKDCLDEGVTRVHKTLGKNVSPETQSAPPELSQPAPEDAQPPPIPLDGPEPLIQDQVFEAYSDPHDADINAADDDFLTAEEKAQRKAAQRDAIRTMKELRSVIAVRAEDRIQRERVARQEAGIVPETQEEEREEAENEEEEELPMPAQHFEDLKLKLSGFSFSQNVAAMAAARSSEISGHEEETFGGDGEMDISDEGSEE